MSEYTRNNREFDLIIVGAGPAGIAAAKVAIEAGVHTAVIDDNPQAGGQIWRGASDQRCHLLQEHLPPPLTYLPSTRLIAAPEQGRILVENVRDAFHLYYNKMILCTGARERLLPLPGWTLPGVMGAGGLQTMVKQGMDVAGKRIVLAGTGPLLLASAQTLHNAGAKVMQIADQSPSACIAKFARSLWRWPSKAAQAASLGWQLRHISWQCDSWVTRILGQARLESVELKLGQQFATVECDWLGIGFGLTPNLELAGLLGCSTDLDGIVVNADLQTSVTGIYAAGEATGIGGVDKALIEGQLAAKSALGLERTPLLRQRQHWLRFARTLNESFTVRPEILQLADAQTVVCRCEDVRLGDIRHCANWREAKLHHRCGMGACQGRICGHACQTLLGWQDAGRRPPLFPARLSSLANIE